MGVIMIKVLHVISRLHQGSGIANVIMNYYRNINRNIVQFDFLVTSTDNGEEYVSEIEKYGGKIYYFPKLRLTNANNFIKEMNCFFGEHKNEYIAVHSHFFQLDGIIFRIAKKYGIKECISHSHNSRYSDYKIKSLRNFIMSLPLKKEATRWMACSKSAGKFLFGKKFYDSPKSLILNNAIDCKKFIFNQEIGENKKKELGLENKFIIGHIGRFSPQKNHEFLINVFKIIKEKQNNAFLVLVGTGPLTESIKKLVKDNQLVDDILFLGQRNDVSDLLQMFDVMVFPSRYEGLGIALIEAQVSDLPCVYSDVIPEEVNILDSNEILSLDENYEVWADAVLKYQNHKRSNNTLKDIERAGYNIVVEAQKLEEFYMSLVNKE